MEALLLLGGNIGNLAGTFAHAEAALEQADVRIAARSRDHVTEPWGFVDERPFLNRALLADTTLRPEELLERCLAVERLLGRERNAQQGYAARNIDIDILFLGDRVIDLPGLVVPHPRVHERAFALGPAADIAPALVHPVLGRTVLQLLNDVLQRS